MCVVLYHSVVHFVSRGLSRYCIIQKLTLPGGATHMARGGIRLVHGFTKSTLITYYSGIKKDPKYAFLHAFFSICLSCSFQNLSLWPKTHFFPILHVFAPLNDVRAYSAWSWKTTLIMWIFGQAWYPPWPFKWPPGTLLHRWQAGYLEFPKFQAELIWGSKF